MNAAVDAAHPAFQSFSRGPVNAREAMLSRAASLLKRDAEETFGPVIAVYTVEDLDEALRPPNDTRYWLAAAIFTANFGNAVRYARTPSTTSMR